MKLKFSKISIDSAQEYTRAKVKNLFKDPEMLGEIGDVMIKDIKYQVRRGISPKTNSPFKPLSQNRHPFLYSIYGRLDRSFAKGKKAQNKLINMREQQKTEGYNYTDIRKYISQSTKTHPAFSVNRSNLTITGQLLDAMTRTISSTGRLTLKFIDSIHRPYKIKTPKGIRDIGKPIRNDELAEYVNAARPFFWVRDSLLPQLKKIVLKHIRRKL